MCVWTAPQHGSLSLLPFGTPHQQKQLLCAYSLRPPSSRLPWLLPVQGCVTAPSSFQRQIHARTHACRSMSGCLGASVVLTVALTAGQALLGCLLGALPAPSPATPLCPRDDNTLVSASPRVSQITRCKRPYLCPSSPAVP